MTKTYLKTGPFLLIFTFFLIRYCYCQSEIEQATRETDRLGRESLEERLKEPIPEEVFEIKPRKEVAPGEEEEKFFVKKINLIGCQSFLPEEFSSIIKEYEEKELTLTELENLAKEIERDYLNRGVIAAVIVPPQEVREGVVTLRVIEAKMGELFIQDHKYFSKDRLRQYWKIYPGRILHYNEISKTIQLMNKNPDREVKAALRAGKKPETTDILLTPQTNFPFHFTSSYDNEGSTSTGKSRIGAGFRHNNFLGIDDTFVSGTSFGEDFYGIYNTHQIPVGFNGASFVYGYNLSKSAPKKEFTTDVIRATAKNVSLELHQDLYKEDEYIGEVSVGFDAKDKTTWMSTIGTYKRDRQRVFKLGADFVKKGFGTSNSVSLDLSQGVAAFGASSGGNPLASRGAKPIFTKFNLGLQQKRVLPHGMQASVKFNSQISSRKLTPQQTFSLGGIDSIRGYPSGDYLADNAATTNIELLMPAFFIPEKLRIPYDSGSLKEQTTALVFLDYGFGKRRGAFVTEKDHANLLSIGTGVRARFFNQALLRLEWGFPLAGNRSTTEAGQSRFHMSFDFQERLPQELERIRQMIEENNIKKWAWLLVDAELKREDSPIRKKLFTYLYLAETYYKQGMLKDSQVYYEKIDQIGTSLYQQAEDYVKELILKQRELKEMNNLALVYYKEDKKKEAKALWEKMLIEAQIKPLILEF